MDLLSIPVGIAECAKRGQGEGGKFHVLFGKRNSYNGDGHQDSKNEVYDGDIETTQQDPQNVKEEVQAAISGSFKIECLAKRGQ